MKDVIYIICTHICKDGPTIPTEAYFDEDKASARLEQLKANALRDIDYSLQWAEVKG